MKRRERSERRRGWIKQLIKKENSQKGTKQEWYIYAISDT